MRKFIAADTFNTQHANMIEKINCLGFAFGMTEPGDYTLWRATDPDTGIPFNPFDTPEKAFIKKASQLGFTVRQVSDKSELDNRVGFILYGWYACRNIYGKTLYNDFHVIRKNADGTVEHKPDDCLPASVTSVEEVEKEYFEKNRRFMFVLEEE